jgi:hypothetical protein
MRIELKLNEEKTKKYNNHIKEFRKKNPEFYKEALDVHCLEDRFIPYEKFDVGNCLIIENDYRNDFKGVYVCPLNSEHTVGLLTDYQTPVDFDSPLYFSNYGVCDNASQALDYYDSLYSSHEDYMKDKSFVILLTPMFRESQPEYGGWRWHKWGQYIGKFKHKREYLYDEKGIDYIYCFNILEVKKD